MHRFLTSEHSAPVVKRMVMTQRYRLEPGETLQWPVATH